MKSCIEDIIDMVWKLPEEVIYEILAHIWDEIAQKRKAIKTASALFWVQKYTNEFLIYRKNNDPQISLPEYMTIHPLYDITDLLNKLLNCGCCERHSTGIIYKYGTDPVKHNRRITGDLTNNKSHNKYTHYNKKCTCPCRNFLRTVYFIYPLCVPCVK